MSRPEEKPNRLHDYRHGVHSCVLDCGLIAEIGCNAWAILMLLIRMIWRSKERTTALKRELTEGRELGLLVAAVTVDLLAQRSGLSARSVKRALRVLRDKNLILGGQRNPRCQTIYILGVHYQSVPRDFQAVSLCRERTWKEFECCPDYSGEVANGEAPSLLEARLLAHTWINDLFTRGPRMAPMTAIKGATGVLLGALKGATGGPPELLKDKREDPRD